jgi:hypothetical protein
MIGLPNQEAPGLGMGTRTGPYPILLTARASVKLRELDYIPTDNWGDAYRNVPRLCPARPGPTVMLWLMLS